MSIQEEEEGGRRRKKEGRRQKRERKGEGDEGLSYSLVVTI
jgi:hypothetical protein